MIHTVPKELVLLSHEHRKDAVEKARPRQYMSSLEQRAGQRLSNCIFVVERIEAGALLKAWQWQKFKIIYSKGTK